MTQSNTLNEAASAISLAAITAGAVAAALPMMSVGFIVAIISLGMFSNDGMPTAKAFTHSRVSTHATIHSGPPREDVRLVKAKKGMAHHLRDAVLREETTPSVPAHSGRKPQPALISNVTHVFA